MQVILQMLLVSGVEKAQRCPLCHGACHAAQLWSTANAFNKKSFQTRNQGLVRLKLLRSASRCHTISESSNPPTSTPTSNPFPYLESSWAPDPAIHMFLQPCSPPALPLQPSDPPALQPSSPPTPTLSPCSPPTLTPSNPPALQPSSPPTLSPSNPPALQRLGLGQSLFWKSNQSSFLFVGSARKNFPGSKLIYAVSY